MSDVQAAIVYAGAAAVFVPLTLSLFRDQYEWRDIALIAISTGLASLVPAIGGPLSLLVMIALMHWRVSADWVPDKTAAIVASRLVCVPVLMLLKN